MVFYISTFVQFLNFSYVKLLSVKGSLYHVLITGNSPRYLSHEQIFRVCFSEAMP
jgi:hypothetical protein